MGLHLQYSAVYRDAVASKHPGNFVAAPENVCLSIQRLTLSSSYTWYPWAPQVTEPSSETTRMNVSTQVTATSFRSDILHQIQQL